jgi:6-phosphogluconate dehydrogenase
MQIGIVGLGRMGANIGRRLMSGGMQLSAMTPRLREGLGGRDRRASLEDWCKAGQPAPVWVMLPAGKITEGSIAAWARCCPRAMS